MTVTVTQLKDQGYISDPNNAIADAVYQVFIDEAKAEIDWYLGVQSDSVPTTSYERAIKLLTVEMFNRARTKNGVPQGSSNDQVPFRLARDSFTVVKPLLDKYIVTGF